MSTTRRTLLVLRHSKSAYPEGMADFDRPLAPRGVRDAVTLGGWLGDQGLFPDLVVCSTAARTRQNPPVTEPAGAAWPARVGLPGQAARRGRGAPRGRRWGILIAGGALAIALALGGLAFHTEQQLNQMRDRSRAIAAVLNEPDAAMMTVTAATQGSATIVMSHQARALVFTAARLPALPSSQRYELWLMGRGGPRAAGMLPQPRAGMTVPVIVSGLRTGDAFAV